MAYHKFVKNNLFFHLLLERKNVFIPRRAVPDDLAISGPVTVVFHLDVTIVGSYNVLPADTGCVRVSCCWKNFIGPVGWKAKTKIVMLSYRRDNMTWLFVDTIYSEFNEPYDSTFLNQLNDTNH